MTSSIRIFLTFLFMLLSLFSFAQVSKKEKLDSVVITSARIDLPFKENSRSITIISAQDIEQSATANVSELLQQVAGIDMRRRGVAGMQTDLYIRGGSFDQTLLLIDGIKVEDPQTGHHTMNMALPLEVIERIEIIKGPAARVFGQNAFTGAVNIVTKKKASKVNSISTQVGAFGQEKIALTVGKEFNSKSIIAHASVNTSDGYRYNTDFKNQNYFLKTTLLKNHTPVNIIGFFTERKFGANGFYASPTAVDQYEETQSSLVALTSQYKGTNYSIKPRLYWKRNQDMYLFIRQNPSFFRNFHISNKIGAEINTSVNSKIGITGFGIDAARVTLSSNNLGNRDRIMLNFFLEHRFTFLNNKLDLTPGIAINYFSDFKSHAFPGIDIGYRINDFFKLYANSGFTYRIPTYTDLFYSDPSTIGNENLQAEEALSHEIGAKFSKQSFMFSTAVFNRISKNLIDYVKENEDDLWEATNIREVNTIGFEVNASYSFKISKYDQNINFGYTFLDENLKAAGFKFSRYSINSLKHHFTSTLQLQFLDNLKQTIVYKYANRYDGQTYSVVDVIASLTLNNFKLSLIGNNLFNTVYSETNLVPMPKGNVLIDAKIKF